MAIVSVFDMQGKEVGKMELNDVVFAAPINEHLLHLAVGAQLGTVVYGAPDAKRGFTVYAPQAFHPRTEVRGGVMEAECAAEMTAFFRAKR